MFCGPERKGSEMNENLVSGSLGDECREKSAAGRGLLRARSAAVVLVTAAGMLKARDDMTTAGAGWQPIPKAARSLSSVDPSGPRWNNYNRTIR
jgi:hypothetical protein